MGWLVPVIFTAVSLPVFLLLLVSFGRKGPSAEGRDERGHAANRQPDALLAVTPELIQTVLPSTGICERPAAGLGPRPRFDEGGLLSALPAGQPPQAVVSCYRSGSGAPPEVRALGEPERVYRPLWWLALMREWPAVFIGLGAALGLLMIVLLASLGMPDNPFTCGFVFGVIGFVITLVVLPLLPAALPTYAVCRDALVVMLDDTYTVIPWGAVVRLDAPQVLLLTNGQRCPLSPNVECLSGLHRDITFRVAERLLPPILQTLDAGGSVAFGPFTVSKAGLARGGHKLPWGEVARISVSPDPGVATRFLKVWEHGGLWPWCFADLTQVPNGWLFLEVIRHACPPRLLLSGRR
jgi:hypothetical protein